MSTKGQREEQREEKAPEVVLESSPPPVLGCLSSPSPPSRGQPEGDGNAMAMIGIEQGNNDINDIKVDGWEVAKAWLVTLPNRRNVMVNEIEAWLQANESTLSREILTMPRQHLYRLLVSQHKMIRRAVKAQAQAQELPPAEFPQQKIETAEWLEPPTARFKRSDKWKPIYSWLESLDCQEIVRTKAIGDWLSQNLDVRDDLLSKHTRYHLVHYIQKCHAKILKKREKQAVCQRNSHRTPMTCTPKVD